MTIRDIRSAAVAGLVLLALVLGAQSGQAQQVSAALAAKAPEANMIATLAQTNGYVRVIVLFSTPTIPNQIRPDAATIASIKAQVASTQNTVLANHFGSAASPRPGRGFDRQLSRFEITPGLAINVDAAELEALAADPLVKNINYDRAMPPTLLQSLPLIGQPAAYTNGATGSGWAVAVLDTGVQSNHEFLSGKVVAEACFSNANGGGGGVSLCPNGLNSQTGIGAADSTTANCINGSTNLCVHGTHVAGIAAGLNTGQSAGEPTNGVARDGKIFAVQIFTRFNTSGACSPSAPPCVLSFTSDQILALDYVYQHLTPVAGVNVASINMSLGGGPNTASACDSDSQKPSIDNLLAAGVLTAIAAGNDGSTTQISHPACISSAVAVGSTTKTDVVSSFSNMANIVALLAPGGFGGGSCTFGGNNPDILSSYAGTTAGQNTLYACFAGTSMATPHVAGAIAAVRTACPSSTANAVLSAFQTSGIPITDTRPGAPGNITKPRIRVDLALAALGCSANALAVSPATNMDSSGPQGGPFSPSSFNYTLSASAGSVNFSISGVPSWLSASVTSGTVTTSGTIVTFTVNASANSLSTATYSATITFTNTTNGQGNQTRTASLTVNSASPALQVTPATNIASNGNQGGPFSPSSFNYQLSATIGSLNYSITGTPSWLNASSTSGTVTTSPTTVTFTVNASANSFAPGAYDATITFTNATNGQGTTFRESTLNVNPSSGAQPMSQTWVSGVGSDSNPCTVALPCLTFQFAHGMTLAGGEINCVNSGDFGPVTITKSIKIRCDSVEGGRQASGTNGIIINAAATDRIVLEGLDIDGQRTGLHGVSVLASKEVYIIRCSIRNFTQNGVNLASSTSGGRALIKDSYIGFNAGGVNVTGPNNVASILNTEIDANTVFAIQANGAGTILGVSNSVLNASPTAISLLSGGSAYSFGPSNVVSGAGAFTGTLPFK